MPLGQKVKVCGRRYGMDEASKASNKPYDPKSFPGLQAYQIDLERNSDSWKADKLDNGDFELWCGHFSHHSAWVFLCESCAVENGLKW